MQMVDAARTSNDDRAEPLLVEPERTLWVIGSTAAAFTGVGPVVECIKKRFPRMDVIYTSRDPALVAWLRSHTPDAIVERRPPALAALSARAIRRRNPRLVLLLDGVAPFEAVLLREARRRQVPIAMVAFGGAPLTDAPLSLLDLIEAFVALDDQGAAALKALGRARPRIAIADDAGRPPTAAAAADALVLLLRRDLKALRSEHRRWSRAAERLAVAAVDHSWARYITNGRAERIATLDDLAARLRHPRTILCLGNGPSSEDPRLRSIAYDALFRVNHLWQERGFLTDPDVVFTGTTDTVRRIGRAIVGAGAINREGRLLLAGLTRCPFRRFRFFTVERLNILVPQASWGDAVPTNGALMLATAVALCPERIVVAGMDLFRHRGGAYPGDTSTPNAYTARHEADLEERVLLETLRAYRGEVVIIGEILRALWEADQAVAPAGAPVVIAPGDRAIGS